MNRDELIAELDELLDPDGMPDYCPNGLQVEGREEIGKIAVGVSASQALFEAAIDIEADAILVHHGILWHSKRIPPVVGSYAERLRMLINEDISLIAYHLPLDRHLEHGNAAILARELGLEGLEPFGNYEGFSTGVCGLFHDPVEVTELTWRLERACNREPLHFSRNETLSSLGIITGGAQRDYHRAVAAGLDGFITGEISEWVMQQVAEDGTAYFSAGHYATETFGVRSLADWIQMRFGIDYEWIDLPNPV